MEEILVSVEELEFSVRDSQTSTSQMNNHKQFLKGEISTTKPFNSHSTQADQKQRYLLQSQQDKQPRKHYSLPSISVSKDGRSNSLVCGEIPSLQDKNNLELHNAMSTLNDQFGVVRNGKKVLGPIQRRKTPQESARQRSNTNPEVFIPKIKHNAARKGGEGEEEETQQNSTGKRGDGLQSTEQLKNGCSLNDSFNESGNGDFLGVPTQNRRRFSAPLSPRFVRRLVPEIFYSKSNNNVNTSSETSTETQHRAPERKSIFSPTSQEFDQIATQDGEQQQKESSTKKNKSPRKSLDVSDFRAAKPTRFLSEIKVSLADKTQGDSTPRKSRVKTDKRKHSYAALSASSEELFTDNVLPPVKTNMPELAPNSCRERASSISFLRNEPSTFDSPMFLDVVGNQRLSHLSLSPRLSRKY